MAIGKTEAAEIRDWARELALEAGDTAKALLGGAWAINRKADGTVVTDIDQAVERLIRDRISLRFPDHTIQGEEYGLDMKAADAPIWSIDPIDGTNNLANHLPHWGVSLGLIADGVPVVGALYFPMLRELYTASLGGGAFQNDEPLSPLPAGGPTTWDDTYAVCSVSVRRIDFGSVPARLRVLGSSALELCWTASGAVRGCQCVGVSLYDVAGGLCVAGEVGAVPAWLHDPAPWSALEMLQNGRRVNDVFMTAPPATLAFMREQLTLRSGDGIGG